MPTDHDALFKTLVGEFFVEFLQLFFPDLAAQIQPDSIQEKEQELLPDWVGGTTNRVDIIRQVELKNEPNLVLILIEPQSYDQKEFGERLFRYFLRLYDKYRLPVFPVAIMSYGSPKEAAPDVFRVGFGGVTTVTFNYVVIQLNRLDWRDFEEQPNPVACALMAKMRMAKTERAEVKLAALSKLTELELNPAQTNIISAFVDTYLSLNEQEQSEFEQKLAQIEPTKKEDVMELTTSWKEQGSAEGLREGERKLVIKLLRRRFGSLSEGEEAQIGYLNTEKLEELAQDLLDFKSRDELVSWLNQAALNQDN